MTRRRLTSGRWLVIAVLCASFAAGCGGDDGGSDASATEWADDVCSAISTWTESVAATAQSLRAADPGEDELRDAVDDFESSTSDFVDELRGLGAPETEAGEQAQESLDQLADDVDEHVSEMKRAVDDVSGVSGILEAVTVIGAGLSALGSQVSAAIASLEDLDAGGELEQAFRDADSCDELQSGGSS